MEKSILPHNFFQMLGLMDRLVNGTIYAENIIIPREGGCQDVGYNIWEILNMRQTFLGWIEKNKIEIQKKVFNLVIAFHGLVHRSSNKFQYLIIIKFLSLSYN